MGIVMQLKYTQDHTHMYTDICYALDITSCALVSSVGQFQLPFVFFQLIYLSICSQFDKLTLVWGKPRQPPLGSEEVRTLP